MKLTLIAVSEPNIYPQICRRIAHTANLVLPVLAAATPPEFELELIDESVHVRPPDYRRLRTDAAALSVRTSCANRAYAVSDALRARGVPTILGGIHPTVLPKEAIRHADAVVIGEAEPVWHRVLDDVRNGRLKRFYSSERYADMNRLAPPCREMLRPPNRALFSFPTLQTARGCPYNCTYCSVTRVYGGKCRRRPVDAVIADLRQIDAPSSHRSRLLSKMANHLLFIVDDNLFSDRRYLIELLTRMRSFRKRWYTQAPAWVGTDPELLHHLRRAGCIILAIGFESVVSESLKQMRKTFNRPARYREIVRRIRNAGIMVAGSFVLGFDGDGPGVFDDTLTFADQAGLDLASFHILTPYPGTPFFERVVREDRLLAPLGDWRRFDTQHVVFRPAKMSPEALQEGFDRLWVEFTSLRSIRLRGRMTPNPLFFWPLNLFQNSLMTTSLVRIRRPAPDRAPAVEDGRWALSAVN